MAARFLLFVLWVTTCCSVTCGQTTPRGQFVDVTVRSSLDQAEQRCKVFLPQAEGPRPLLVFLHSWSSDLTQNNNRWLDLAKERNWVFVHPDFRGKNLRPEACGSALARQDILDAVQWALNETAVDRSRIYLAGTSGGGMMTMLMVAYHPDRFSAASSWVGISDITKWYAHTNQAPGQSRYAREIELCVGGIPGSSPAVDAQLRERSPVFHLARAKDVPFDINTGVHDGHTGSVPVSQSFEAFNALAVAHGDQPVAAEVIAKWVAAGADRAEKPAAVEDKTYDRAILFRAESGPTRLSVFEGTHEDRPLAGMEFLESKQRETSWPVTK